MNSKSRMSEYPASFKRENTWRGHTNITKLVTFETTIVLQGNILKDLSLVKPEKRILLPCLAANQW